MTLQKKNPSTAVPLTATPARAQRANGEWVRWNKAMKADFLDTLAATCDVTKSAAAIGVGTSSVYALRRRDPAFLEEWAQALRQGYQLIETLLLGHVLAGGARDKTIPDTEERGAIDVDTAIRLLNAHRTAQTGTGGGIAPGRTGRAPNRGGGPRQQRASDADTDAAILKKLDAIDKRRALASAALAEVAVPEDIA